jgi:hypothetical protein
MLISIKSIIINHIWATDITRKREKAAASLAAAVFLAANLRRQWIV